MPDQHLAVILSRNEERRPLIPIHAKRVLCSKFRTVYSSCRMLLVDRDVPFLQTFERKASFDHSNLPADTLKDQTCSSNFDTVLSLYPK